MMLECVWSGGQTGTDMAALRAARATGLATGGFACQGWLIKAEDGRTDVPAPWLADYGLVECDRPGFPARRLANASRSDGTLLFFNARTPGTKGLVADFRRLPGKPLGVVHSVPSCNIQGADLLFRWDVHGRSLPGEVAWWIEERGIRTLNCAGPRASNLRPGGEEEIEKFLIEVFEALAPSR